jgi:hypothetical protein
MVESARHAPLDRLIVDSRSVVTHCATQSSDLVLPTGKIDPFELSTVRIFVHPK